MPKRPQDTTSDKPKWPYQHITSMTADVHRGQWTKKNGKRRHSFGPLADHAGALKRWMEEWPAIRAGERPKPKRADNDIALGELCGAFLQAKRAAVDLGQLSEELHRDYDDAATKIVGFFGVNSRVSRLGPESFRRYALSLAEIGMNRRSNLVVWTKSIFRWGVKHAKILSAEPDYGVEFRTATAAERRAHKYLQRKNLFTAEQVRSFLNAAGVHLRAMILLGINGGLGNMDCATLLWGNIVEVDGLHVIDYLRFKSKIPRKVPLWPETWAALEASRAKRPAPAKPEWEDRVFITHFGRPWKHGSTDAVGGEFSMLMRRLKLKPALRSTGAKKRGQDVADGVVVVEPARPMVKRKIVSPIGFYTLKRTCSTVADAALDKHAKKWLLGHSIGGMDEIYDQGMPMGRIIAVAEHVRRWLYGDKIKPMVSAEVKAKPKAGGRPRKAKA